jgi:TrmH family RNA methyltransferase
MLSSKENPLIKVVSALQKKKGRLKHRLFIAEGPHLIQEAFASPYAKKIRGLILEGKDAPDESDYSSEVCVLVQAAKAGGIPLHYVTKRLFKEVAETENPQGILALIDLPPTDTPQQKTEFPSAHDFLGLLLNEIQDPGNLGTILRTAWGAGIKDLFITPGTVDPYSGKVVRSSQGGVFNLNIHQTPLAQVISWAREKGVTIVSGDPRGRKVYYDHDFTAPTLILLGNEGRGPQQAAATAGLPVQIPLPGGAESLNVATAGGILIFEALRQRSRC